MRIVTVDLRTFRVGEFVYLLHNTAGATTAVSEISALSDHEFLVDERDGNVEPGANKKLYTHRPQAARPTSDPAATCPARATTARPAACFVGGKTLEGIVQKSNTADSQTALAGRGHQAGRLGSCSSTSAGSSPPSRPDGSFFGHDKVEGVAVLDGGRRVVISNDSDFGIDALANAAPPYQLHTRRCSPTASRTPASCSTVDLTKVPAAVQVAS